jgi:hypothetical protein
VFRFCGSKQSLKLVSFFVFRARLQLLFEPSYVLARNKGVQRTKSAFRFRHADMIGARWV